MSFKARHWNRLKMPVKHVLVCEDDLTNQALAAAHFRDSFEPQGEVEFSFVSGAMAAAGVVGWTTVHLILLDHDMPHGNGADLVRWLRSSGRAIPVITFSGIPENNRRMMELGADHCFEKQAVLRGEADGLMRSILGLAPVP